MGKTGKKILLLGGGGHCRSVYDSVLAMKEYDEIGIVLENGASVSSPEVVGTDADLPALREKGWGFAVVTVGSVGDVTIRRRLFHTAKQLGFLLPVIVDPTAVIASDARLGEGCYIAKRAVVNAGAGIGSCVIINTGAVIEHGCMVGDYAHISSGAVLSGEVSIGEGAHIGAGSVVRQQIRVGDGTLIGIGSAVVKDIPDFVTAYGNPCRVMEK
ncbi:MAG: acetyltransferase [Lachnospiraceae bacterium]|nr:acetyltransferase [Lachnospiraceae bacterium]